jgi:hypothetical protein
MEIIPERPISKEYDNVLVIKDKVAKYTNFIPTSTSIAGRSMIIAKFGIPRPVIMNRDICQTGRFWEKIANRMGLKRSLTTTYQLQTD